MSSTGDALSRLPHPSASGRVAASGRFSLDNLETVIIAELVPGDVFIYDGEAFMCMSVPHQGFDGNSCWVDVQPWPAPETLRLYFGCLDRAALLA